MNISPIYFYRKNQKNINTQINPIKYKNELQKDTVSFCGSSNKDTLIEASKSAIKIDELARNYPQEAIAYLNNLPKEELLDVLPGKKDKCQGTALRIADDDTFSLYMQAAKNANCLEDIVFFEADSLLAKFEICLSSSAIQEYSEIISSKT